MGGLTCLLALYITASLWGKKGNSVMIFILLQQIYLEKNMTRLLDEMLEILTCLKDWEDTYFRLQKEEDEYARTLEKLDLNSEQDDFEIDDEN